MKKLLIFLFTIIALPGAFAQEIFIAGRSFSLVTILPVILMAIMLLFFLFIFIKDHLIGISKLTLKFLKFPKLSKKRIKKEEVVEFDYLKEIKKFENEVDKIDSKDALKNLDEIAKHFFRDKLKLDYEFTLHELKDILKEGKRDWVEFSEKLSNLKYSGGEVSKGEVTSLIKDFKKIARIREHIIGKKKLGFMDKLKKIVPKPKKTKITPKIKYKKEKKLKLKFIDKFKKEYISGKLRFFIKIRDEEKKILGNIKKYIARSKEENRANAVNNLISNGISLLDKDIKEAQENYAKAFALYYQLPLEEEVYIGNKLADFHNKIEEAINKKQLEEINQITKKIEELKSSYTIPKKEDSILTKIEELKDDFLSLRDFKGKVKGAKIRNIELLLISYAKRLSRSIKLIEKRGIEDLSHAERKFIDELKSLVNYIKKKEEVSLESVKLVETNLLDRIKRLSLNMKRKQLPTIRKEYPLAKKEIEIKPRLEVREIIKPLEIKRIPKAEIKSFRLKEPRILIKLKKSEEIKKLVKEEKDIIGRLANIEKTKGNKLFVNHLTKRKAIKKFSWESYAEKIRNQKTEEMRNLINEENKLISKINKAK